MIKGIIKIITKRFLLYLDRKGVDVISEFIVPETEDDVKINELLVKFGKMQSGITLKRGEVIEAQKDLIIMIEPIIFSYLSGDIDGWEKSLLTKTWGEKVNKINMILDEHDQIAKSCDEIHNKLQVLNS